MNMLFAGEKYSEYINSDEPDPVLGRIDDEFCPVFPPVDSTNDTR